MIKFCDNSFELRNGQIIDLDFDELNNGLYLICGQNGSGKSTFLDYIYDQKIELEINGSKYKYENRNSIVSYANQSNIFLNELTVIDNIKLAGSEIDDIKPILDQIHSSYILEDNNLFSKLSGGEKQKIKIAVNFTSDRNLILLDEIDSNLDNETVYTLIPLLKQLSTNNVILLVSHNWDLYNSISIGKLKIVNNTMSLIDDKSRCINISHQPEIEVTNETSSNKKLVQPLNLYFNKTYIIYFLIAMTFSFVFMSSTKELNMLNYVNLDTNQQFNDNSSVILPPINSPYVDMLSDRSWFTEIPLLFDEEFYTDVQQLDYVTNIQLIPNLNKFSNYVTYVQNGNQFRLENPTFNIEISKLNESVKELANQNSIQLKATNSLEFSQLPFKQVIAENTPYTAGIMNLYGTFPEDNTDQIMIPLEVAEYLIEQDNLNSIDDLIGLRKQVELIKVDGVNPIGSAVKTFEVSGIYAKPKNSVSQIIYAYNDDSIISKENNCGLSTGLDLEACAFQTSTYQYTTEQFKQLLDDKLIGNYSGLYVEVSDEEHVKELTKFIRNIDSHIFIDNDYTRNNEVLNRTAITKIVNVFKQYVMLLIIYGLATLIMYQYQLTKMEKVNMYLNHVNFSSKTYNQYITKKLWVYKTIGLVSLMLPYILSIYQLWFDYSQYGFYNKQYLIVMTCIYIIMIIALNIFFNILTKWFLSRSKNETRV